MTSYKNMIERWILPELLKIQRQLNANGGDDMRLAPQDLLSAHTIASISVNALVSVMKEHNKLVPRNSDGSRLRT